MSVLPVIFARELLLSTFSRILTPAISPVNCTPTLLVTRSDLLVDFELTLTLLALIFVLSFEPI